MVLGDRSLGRAVFDVRNQFVLLVLGGLGLVFAQKWTYFRLTGPQIPGLTPEGTWLAYHLLVEAVAVVLVLAGLFGLRWIVWDAGRIERAGFVLAGVSCALLVPTHTAEHLLGGFAFSTTLTFGSVAAVPMTFDLGGLAYYLNWIAFGTGMFVFGVTAWLRGAFGNTTAVLFAVPLPIGVVGGLLAVATGTYPFLGINRLIHGTVWATVGYLFAVEFGESAAAGDHGVTSGSDR